MPRKSSLSSYYCVRVVIAAILNASVYLYVHLGSASAGVAQEEVHHRGQLFHNKPSKSRVSSSAALKARLTTQDLYVRRVIKLNKSPVYHRRSAGFVKYQKYRFFIDTTVDSSRPEHMILVRPFSCEILKKLEPIRGRGTEAYVHSRRAEVVEFVPSKLFSIDSHHSLHLSGRTSRGKHGRRKVTRGFFFILCEVTQKRLCALLIHSWEKTNWWGKQTIQKVLNIHSDPLLRVPV